MIIKIKQISKGRVSLRNYLFKKCIDKEENLIIKADPVQMTIPLSRVKSMYQTHKTRKTELNQKYKLITFYFVPDNEN